MKKLLLILLCLPFIGFGQQKTYVPDDAFESHLIGQGYDNQLDDSVYTAIISPITDLGIISGVSDFTGIEDFISLTDLTIHSMALVSLDLSQNINLIKLEIYHTPNLISLNLSGNTNLWELRVIGTLIQNIDLSNNIKLRYLTLSANQLSSLDLSNNTDLMSLRCSQNQLTSLDLSNNNSLGGIQCYDNQLNTLDLRNIDIQSTNPNVNFMNFSENPNLFCIDVDDWLWATSNWTVASGIIDPQQSFSTSCSGTSINEHTTNKELLKVTDLLGRETKQTNQPLLYLYDDGTVEKKLIIE